MNCQVALKEWAITCEALAQGRQVILLRKGGLLDPAVGENEGGTFTLEYSNFYLWPSSFHQDRHLVKTHHHDLFGQVGTKTNDIVLPLWAQVERVWKLFPDDEECLMQVRHIWSRDYVDVRFSYKLEHPLLCAALRVYALPQAHVVAMQSRFGGCRSWIELDENLPFDGAQPALNDDDWNAALAELTRVFG